MCAAPWSLEAVSGFDVVLLVYRFALPLLEELGGGIMELLGQFKGPVRRLHARDAFKRLAVNSLQLRLHGLQAVFAAEIFQGGEAFLAWIQQGRDHFREGKDVEDELFKLPGHGLPGDHNVAILVDVFGGFEGQVHGHLIIVRYGLVPYEFHIAAEQAQIGAHMLQIPFRIDRLSLDSGSSVYSTMRTLPPSLTTRPTFSFTSRRGVHFQGDFVAHPLMIAQQLAVEGVGQGVIDQDIIEVTDTLLVPALPDA